MRLRGRRLQEALELDRLGWAEWRGRIGGDLNVRGATVAGRSYLGKAPVVATVESLAGFDLTDMVWQEVIFLELIAKGSDLRDGALVQCSINAADFDGAQFAGAKVLSTSFAHVDFAGAHLAWRADHSEFRTCNFARSDWAAAILGSCSFINCSFEGARGLSRARVSRPCALDAKSIAALLGVDGGANFLVHAGFPREVVEYLPDSLAAAFGAVRWQSCFLSHSESDNDFCEPLYQRLNAAGVQTWYSPHHMRWGEEMFPQIHSAISAHDRLLLVLSTSSMASDWVATEIKAAYRREKEDGGRRVLFPISLVPFHELTAWSLPYHGVDLAEMIRGYYIPFVRDWKTDSKAFEEQFAKLLAALKKDERG